MSLKKPPKLKINLGSDISQKKKNISEGVSLDKDSYQVLKKIGKGSFGHVYQILHHKEKKVMALKVIISQSDDDHIRKLISELKIHFGCDHENIVRCYGYKLEKNVLYIAMEFMDFDNLQEILKLKKTLHENIIGYFAL